jgi:fructose-bisphosphate aldolase class I
VQEVATATLRCLRRHVPAAVPGIVFLSGGQPSVTATAHLDAIIRLGGPKPWSISFSYGRALQDVALEAWHGQKENVKAGQQAFQHRAQCNSEAALGRYTDKLEREPAGVNEPAHRSDWHDD